MLAILRQHRLAPAVVLAVVLLAAVNWILDPEDVSRWLRAIFILPLFWLGLTLWHCWALRSVRRRNIDDEPGVTRYFSSTLSLMIVAIGVAVLGAIVWMNLGPLRRDR